MATINTVLTFSRAQAQTDSNGLTDTNGLIYANNRLVDFHRRLTAHSIDASQTQEAYRDATANQGTYLYPDDMLWLKTIECNYNDTSANNYLLATQVDVSNLPGQVSFSWLRQNATTNNPQFDDRGDQFEIFPTPIAGNNLSQFFRIFYFLKPTEYTSTTDQVSYPESLDYRILGWGICADYYMSLNKFDEAQMFEAKYEKRIVDYIATLGRGSQQPIQATSLAISGWEF